MRRNLLAALALSTAALGVPAVHAAPQYEGGCGFVAGTDSSGEITNPDTYTGVVYAAVVGYDDSGTGNPASTSVTCNLYVNGTLADSATFNGTPVAAGAEDTSYVALDGDTVELCDHVIVNGHDFGEICFTADHIPVPPQEAVDIATPFLCAAGSLLAGAGAGDPPPSYTGWWPPDPDYYMLGSLWIDCPPYQGGGVVQEGMAAVTGRLGPG